MTIAVREEVCMGPGKFNFQLKKSITKFNFSHIQGFLELYPACITSILENVLLRGYFFNTFIIYEMQRQIVRNDCFWEYPVAFFIVFKEVAHAVLIQTLKVKSLFILTYIFKMLFQPLLWGTENVGKENAHCAFLSPWFVGNQSDCHAVEASTGRKWSVICLSSLSILFCPSLSNPNTKPAPK